MRLHPLTVVRDAARYGGGALLTAFFASTSVDGGWTLPVVGLPILWVLVPAAVALSTAFAVARYRAYEYELTDDALVITSGVLSRKRREIPLGRVQTIDLNQSILGRVAGVTSIQVETAGGGQTEATLSLVDRGEAERLRREMRQRRGTEAAVSVTGETGPPDGASDAASGVTDQGTVTADRAEHATVTGRREDGEDVLFSLSDRELRVLSAITVQRVAVLGLVAGAPFGSQIVFGIVRRVLAFAGVGQPIPRDQFLSIQVLLAFGLLVGLVVVVTWAASAAVTFASYYGFTLTREGEDLRYQRGLLRRLEGTIPVDKIQTLTVTESVPMRRFGYAALAVETAGYAPGSGDTERSPSAVPLADRDRVFDVTRGIEGFDLDLAAVDLEPAPKRVRRRYATRYALSVLALTAVALALSTVWGWLPWYLPLGGLPLCPVAGHYRWKHLGYYLGEDHLVTRSGFWRRRTQVVPYYRLQTVIVTRTLFQRRWGLATVTADTASSTSVFSGGARVLDVDREVGDELHRELRERLREAVAEGREPGSR